MSTEENTRFVEGLRDRLVELLPQITPGNIADFERYLAENDLRGAEAYIDSLEAVYADDLLPFDQKGEAL